MSAAMKKILITGFEPFGGEEINPSWMAVSRLPDEINGCSVAKLSVPVVFGVAGETVIRAAEEHCPDIILCVGQAGGRRAVTPEMLGINLRYASIPDNAGNEPKDQPVVEGGENAMFSTLPVRKIAEAINAAGVLSQVSYSAGAYVCNDLLYTLLHRYKNTETRVGFIHVPYCTEQKREPCMEMDDIVKALVAAVECIDIDGGSGMN